MTRTKVRITVADLESNGGAANALATNPAANEPGPTGGQAGCATRAQVWFDVGRTDAALKAVSDDTALRRE